MERNLIHMRIAHRSSVGLYFYVRDTEGTKASIQSKNQRLCAMLTVKY